MLENIKARLVYDVEFTRQIKANYSEIKLNILNQNITHLRGEKKDNIKPMT